MTLPLTLAFDIGGTQVRAAVVDTSGQVLRRVAALTDVKGGPSAIVAQIMQMADHVIGGERSRLVAAGVSAPGPLDSVTGTIIDIPTLPGWTDYPLRQVLGERFGLPVILENDGIAAAFGEWKFGAGRGLSDLVYITVSTGIGGGVVADGKILKGRRGMAGHIGHMMIDRHGPRCKCGGTGCFEVLASGSALAEAAQAGGFDDARTAVEAARRGDERAAAMLAHHGDLLGYGFASLLYLYSPQRLIMGGGVSAAFDLLAPRIRLQIERLVMAPFRAVELVAAELGDNAGLAGAAGLALSQNFRA